MHNTTIAPRFCVGLVDAGLVSDRFERVAHVIKGVVRFCLAGLVIWGGAVAAATPPVNGHRLILELSPAEFDAHGALPYLDVALDIDGVTADRGETVLQLSKVSDSTVTSADQLSDLQVADAKGPLRLTVQDLELTPNDVMRRWQADRTVVGTVRVRYRISIDAQKPLVGSPMTELRTGEYAFSGAGASFLALPDDDLQRTVWIRWVLPPGAKSTRAISNLGVGDQKSRQPLTVDALRDFFFMHGAVGVFQSEDGALTGSWAGTPTFAMDQVMRWSADLRRFYAHFFRSQAAKFSIFARPNPVNPGSGIGLKDGFAFTYGPDTTEQGVRLLLGHEMVHALMVSLDEENDPGNTKSAWFNEGLAVYYQRALPLRAGLIDASVFLEDLNRTAAQYYTSAKRNGTNAEVVEKFWSDARVRLLPYQRGSLYFAQVDAAVLAKSGGKRSLDNLIHTVIDAHVAGTPVNAALWRKILSDELGPQGVADFESMMAGGLVLPPSDAYGPCFRRVLRKTRPFDPGFSMSAFTPPGKIVDLVHGSEAEKAGVREGDMLLKGGVGDRVMLDPTKTLRLQLSREGKIYEVRYLPRGAPVDTYQWEQSEVPGCAVP
ncbi:hypothetical protein LL965_08780 [Xanthomonas cassavae CFBP 4642]|uniref:Peptidase M61 catalytic domain-containing protein n=1 Tax=Xanthomonas cassavae CFBP 4642 TaxID=1219375 RepID=A0ABS8HDP7_9XANT|nr:hypothetical protein [Xanthomonas cassavae]MCC4620177.1 hypothetical protein [Xanthomonas cassavae CFBP 4642]